jgi:hypothetical protein
MRLNGKLYVTAARICFAVESHNAMGLFFLTPIQLFWFKNSGACAWWNMHAAVNKFAKSPRGVLVERRGVRGALCTPTNVVSPPFPRPHSGALQVLYAITCALEDADITSSPDQRFCVSCSCNNGNNPLVNHTWLSVSFGRVPRHVNFPFAFPLLRATH